MKALVLTIALSLVGLGGVAMTPAVAEAHPPGGWYRGGAGYRGWHGGSHYRGWYGGPYRSWYGGSHYYPGYGAYYSPYWPGTYYNPVYPGIYYSAPGYYGAGITIFR